MIAKERAQSRRRHRLTSLLTFKGHEDGVGRRRGPLKLEVAAKEVNDFAWKRHSAFLLTLAAYPDVGLHEIDVLEAELDNLSRSQPAKKHQGGECKVTPVREALEESADLAATEGHDDTTRRLHTPTPRSLPRWVEVARRRGDT